MNLKATIVVLAILGLSLQGCTKPTPETSTDATATPAATATVPDKEAGKKTDLPPITVGAYTVSPYYLDDLAQGRINFNVAGGDVKAVRTWIGDEAATGALVIKAPWEDDHYCGDQEVPNPLPPDAKLWVELETPGGELFKGSTPLGK